MLYITLGDQPSGIYQGQVVDVCQFLEAEFKTEIRLVAFISARDFKNNAAKIKNRYAKAIVLPMVPKLKNWALNRISLAMICLFTGERIAICRNVLATQVALSLKKTGLLKKVCFDGRGAIAAEWEEYPVVTEAEMVKQIPFLEKAAVLDSDYRIAVSAELVNYWRKRFGYTQNDHANIPCTLSTNFTTELPSEAEIANYKQQLGYAPQDIVLLYSGSTAGWQSFSLVYNFLNPLLQSNRNIKVLFLSKEDENNTSLLAAYPGQITIKWLSPDEVNKYLLAADYGILLREKSVTNRVASPTKFAEYLVAGLPVLISEELGDYSAFVRKENCGLVVSDGAAIHPVHTQYEEKVRLNQLAVKYFLKDSTSNRTQYQKLLKSLS